MKRNITGILSLCLCLAIILGSLAGCGGNNESESSYDIASVDLNLKTRSSGENSGGETESGTVSPAVSPYQSVWHSGENFADIEYEHYDYEDFQTLADRIYKFASSGGTTEKFQVADTQIVNELYYIASLYTLSDISYMQDSSDKNSEERTYTTDIYNDAINEYWSAMSAVANSEYCDLLESHYADWQIEQFAAYDSSYYDETEAEKLARENELIQEYYSLISEDEPDYDKICDIYVELINLRNAQAADYGYNSYAEYCYESVYSRDYSPEEAQKLWKLAKEYFCPLVDELYFELMYSDYLPDVDYSEESILNAMGEVLPQISGDLYAAFQVMLEKGLYDISDNPEKQEIGFTTLLYYQNLPFIYNKPDNSFLDYTAMFHEFGHFANYYYTESDLIFGVSDNDISELQSQGLEVLALNFYDQIFGENDAQYITKEVLLNLLYSIVDGCMYDEFQQRIYGEENLTADRVKEIYADVYEEYGYELYEGADLEWADVPHNFEYPFYYISYAVSAVPALELYAMMQDSFDEAVGKYLEVSAMDTEAYYFSEAIEEVGFGGVFDEETAQEVSNALR